MGAHKPGAMIAHTDFEDQNEDGSCNCNLTYSEKVISIFCPLFFVASSAEYGSCNRLRRSPSFETYSSLIKTVDKPWSMSASKITGKSLVQLLIKQHQ